MLARMDSLSLVHGEAMPAQIRFTTEFAWAVGTPTKFHLIMLLALMPPSIVMSSETLVAELAVEPPLVAVIITARREGGSRIGDHTKLHRMLQVLVCQNPAFYAIDAEHRIQLQSDVVTVLFTAAC
mmetsp:Transcript_7846/g.20748  ORF Transcript_7846/g.20748 Transcript_7846/m.20748 type:complete len:126 (+) Transcript_7846:836-1213(+)